MLKMFIIAFCLLFTFGCETPKTYTTQREYSEEYAWDKEKGIVKNYNASGKIEWK